MLIMSNLVLQRFNLKPKRRYGGASYYFSQPISGERMSNAPKSALEVNIELRWSDQDLLGHVNNAKLMTLAEEARIRSLTRVQKQLAWKGPLEMVLRTTQTEFLRPVLYEDSVKIYIWISKIGNTSYVMQHELVQNGQVCVTVEAVVVMFDIEKQAPMPLPAEIRAAFEAISI